MFDYLIPTLDNVIVDDGINFQDLNVNMISILGSSILYSNKKEGQKIRKKDAIEVLPFLWKE
jgi:hypothetical protein